MGGAKCFMGASVDVQLLPWDGEPERVRTSCWTPAYVHSSPRECVNSFTSHQVFYPLYSGSNTFKNNKNNDDSEAKCGDYNNCKNLYVFL